MQRNQVGLVPSIYVNNDPKLLGNTPQENVDEELTTIVILSVTIGVLLIVAILRNFFFHNTTYVRNNFERIMKVEKKKNDSDTDRVPLLGING